jgi:sugar phosphate isomerase/epimerase
MELGIHVNIFRRPTLEETLDAVAGYGFRSVHFNMAAAGVPSMPEKISDELCERIAADLSARDIAMASLSGTFNMIHPSVDVRRAGLRRLRSIAAKAHSLGTALIALCTGTRDPDDMWRPHPGNDAPDAWADLVDSVSKALEIAEEHDLTMGIEPEVSNVVDSAAKARRLLDQMACPRLKIIIDGANLFHAGELPRMREILDEAFALLGRDIVLAHAKDLNRDGQAGNIPAGSGVLDYDHYLALLDGIGFKGALILHSLHERDVRGCVAFLEKKMAALRVVE